VVERQLQVHASKGIRVLRVWGFPHTPHLEHNKDGSFTLDSK
jgi:hypothetical protein